MSSPFKVIVVGAGPAGLVAAHALAKANIAYVVLEAQPIVAKDVGASIAIQAFNMRVLAQLGLLDGLREKGHEVLHTAEFTQTSLMYQNWPDEFIREDFGTGGSMFHRAELVQLFYDGLSEEDQARIHLNKKVNTIENTEDGVIVTCTDGSTYEGSIVLGADGVHSKVRAIIREHMLKEDPESDVDDINPFPATYKTLWCSFPRRWEFAPGDHCVTHANGASLQLLVASRRSWVFAYEKLDKPTNERVRYTDADFDEFCNKHGEMSIGNRTKLKDVVKHQTAGSIINLEEGIAKNWSHGRIVLVGDSCHKFTPNTGDGLNAGIQDIVALVNELHALCKLSGPPPSQVELTAAFRRYHETRIEVVKSDLAFSAHTTRLVAWPNTTYWLVDQWVMPYIPFRDALIRKYLIQPKVSNSLCFDFIEGEEHFMGKIPWKHSIPKGI